MGSQSKGLTWGLLILRLGLGVFLAICALNKVINPEAMIPLFLEFYYIDVSSFFVVILGALELMLSLLFIMGMYKTLSYGIALVSQIIMLIACYEKIKIPAKSESLFFMLIPIIFAFGALFVMRNLDNKWTLTRKPSMFS